MMRASSPPEAIFWMGLSASPTLADIKNCTSSIPVASMPCSPALGAKSTLNWTFGISNCRSSLWMRSSRARAASCLDVESSFPFSLAVFRELDSFFSRRARVSLENRISSSSLRQCSR